MAILRQDRMTEVQHMKVLLNGEPLDRARQVILTALAQHRIAIASSIRSALTNIGPYARMRSNSIHVIV